MTHSCQRAWILQSEFYSCHGSGLSRTLMTYSFILSVFVFVESLSCNPLDCSMPDFAVLTTSLSLLKLMSIESVMPSNHLILCCPLLLPSILPSIRVFSNESVLHIRWPKYWSFSFSINPSNSGLIFFRTDWFDLPAVQGTLKSLLQHHSSTASILCSVFFTVQLSHLHDYRKNYSFD